MVLLTPGPCMTSDSVRMAAAFPDLNHRDPAFLEMVSEVKNGLLTVYPGAESFVPYLIGGSGTAAVEAMIISYLEPSWTVLVLENGYYSGRVADILKVHRIPHKELAFGWLDAWDLETIERALRTGQFQAVIGTHHETTSGRLNPVSALADLCTKLGVHCLVDAMSSFGADDIDFRGIGAVCSSSNKCLHGVPGVSFVLAHPSEAERMRTVPRRSYYLSLPMYEGDRPPLTPPVPALAALRQALRELEGGTASGRRATYEARANLIRDGLAGRGFGFAIPRHEFSCSLTVASLPSGWTWDAWFAANLEAGYMLYECKGDLRDRFFQVANMGELSGEQLEGWLLAVDRILAT
jgi:2-aminoethylphosphonate-pyruvate transaminase